MAYDGSIRSALDVMQAHIDALNSRDEHALIAALHFPHFRLSGVALRTWETPERYFAHFRGTRGYKLGPFIL